MPWSPVPRAGRKHFPPILWVIVGDKKEVLFVIAEGNGKPDREQRLATTAEERAKPLDRYPDTTRRQAGTTICVDIGCWRPAEESWEQFVERKRRP